MRSHRSAVSWTAIVLAAVVLGGCGAINVVPVGPGPDCEKSPVEAVLHVNGSDPRQVWATDLRTGRDINVRPRPALGWMINPTSPQQLVDPAGRVATFDGEIFRQACFEVVTNTFYVGPDDLPDPNRPPG